MDDNKKLSNFKTSLTLLQFFYYILIDTICPTNHISI